MTTENDWQEWSQAWKSGESTPPALLTRLRRDRRKQIMSFVAEIIACLFLIVFYGVLRTKVSSASVQTLAIANFVFAVVWLGRLFTTFRSTWSTASSDTRAFIDLARRRIEAQLRWLAFVRRCILVLAIGGAAWMTWVSIELASDYLAQKHRLIIGVVGFASIIVFLVITTRRKTREAERELAEVNRVLREE